MKTEIVKIILYRDKNGHNVDDTAEKILDLFAANVWCYVFGLPCGNCQAYRKSLLAN